jgi:peptidoglycan LD-endopeptidase LytH
MRAQTLLPRSGLLAVLCAVVVAAVTLSWPAAVPASAADPRLERAQQERQEMQQRLGQVLERLEEAQARLSESEAQLAELQALEAAHGEQASQANSAMAQRIRSVYKHGSPDPTLAVLTLQSPDEALEHMRLLGLLAVRSRADMESATAAQIRTHVAAGEVAKVGEEVRAHRDAVEAARAEAAALLAEAEQAEQPVRATIAAEEAARQRAAREAAERAARQRAAQQRPSRALPAASGAPVTGSVACPIGTPRSYSDTYGAPRSGGRSHKGTDIMAPRGTPIYAYENGSITRLSSSRLGGISLYLRGDSGNVYYYAHLQGYVAGLSAGQRVSVGQHIAFNGDTGNARGIPHLHFEVMPGGGGNVNPYPYVRRACG